MCQDFHSFWYYWYHIQNEGSSVLLTCAAGKQQDFHRVNANITVFYAMRVMRGGVYWNAITNAAYKLSFTQYSDCGSCRVNTVLSYVRAISKYNSRHWVRLEYEQNPKCLKKYHLSDRLTRKHTEQLRLAQTERTHLFSFQYLWDDNVVLFIQTIDDDSAGVVVPRCTRDVQHTFRGGCRLNIVAWRDRCMLY